MDDPKLTVADLRDRLDTLVDGGHGHKPVMFGPDGSKPVNVAGGIVAEQALLLAPLSLADLGDF